MTPRLVDVTPLLRAACAEAIRIAHPHVGSEHLAMLALPGPDGLVAMAREAGVDAAGAATILMACCRSPLGRGDADAEPRITPRTARLAAWAAQLALLDGSGMIRPIHVAAALLAEPGAVAWTGLMAAGIAPGAVAAGVARRRPGWSTDAASPTARGHPSHAGRMVS